MQSDLEEGEIPDFEPSPTPSDQEVLYIRSQRVCSSRLRSHERRRVWKFPNKTRSTADHKPTKRYDSLPSEGEYISEEEKLVHRKRMSHKDLYKRNLTGKAPKNFHPVKHSYDSVEDIMSKIGQSLDRHGNNYYNERRSIQPRYVITINDSHNKNPVVRQTSPTLRRMGFHYYSRRRYGELKSEPFYNIREKYGRMNYKKMIDARRLEKEVPKSGRREHSKINGGSLDRRRRSKKSRVSEEKVKGTHGCKRRQKKYGFDPRLLKEISLPQVQKYKGQNFKQLPNSNDSNGLDNTKDTPPDRVEGNDIFNSPTTAALDGNSAINNSTNKIEKLNDESYDGDEDEDEDIELIKLRLLALISNKKKSQNVSNNDVDNIKDLEKRTGQNVVDAVSSTTSIDIRDEKENENEDENENENEKIKANSSFSNDEVAKERQIDNEIDRYELFLRAEALKTALVRKHHRIVKKRKNVSAISGQKQAMGESSENKLKENEMDIDLDIICDEDLVEKDRDSDSDAQLEVSENYEKPETNSISKSNSEISAIGENIDIHQEDGLHSERLVTAVNADLSEKISLPADCSTVESIEKLKNLEVGLNAATEQRSDINNFGEIKPAQIKMSIHLSEKVDISTSESNEELKNLEIDLNNASTEQQLEINDSEEIKPAQIKESLNLSEKNIEENNLSSEKRGDCVKTKPEYSIDLGYENIQGSNFPCEKGGDCLKTESEYSIGLSEKNIKQNNSSCEKKGDCEKDKSGYSVNLSKKNIKQSNSCSEKKGDCQKTKSELFCGLSDKNKVSFEKESNLIHTSNLEINSSSNTSNTQTLLDEKKNHKNIPQKPTISNKEEPTAKIPEAERIIVYLGSDSSDEECVPDGHSDEKSHALANNESTEVIPSVPYPKHYNIKEFEKSVDLLLNGARKRIESRQGLNSGITSTPEAVYSHLAPSQRLEYIRLKQEIAEREKLGRAEKNILNSSSALERNKSKVNSIGDKIINQINTQQSSAKRQILGQIAKENNKTQSFKNQLAQNEEINPCGRTCATGTSNSGPFRDNKSLSVNRLLNLKNHISEVNSQKGAVSILRKDSSDLNSKNTIKKDSAEIFIERKKMFNQNKLHLERLKALCKDIRIEQMIERKYQREVKKLKIQQNFFELKINQQKLKIKKLADESKRLYEAFKRNNKKVREFDQKIKAMTGAENGERMAFSSGDTSENDQMEDKEIRKKVTEHRGKRMKLSHEDTTDNNGAEDKEVGNKVTENRREKMKRSREDTTENNGVENKEIGKDITESRGKRMKFSRGDTTENNGVENKEIGKDITESKGKKMKLSRKDTVHNKEIGKDVTESRGKRMKLSRGDTKQNNGVENKENEKDITENEGKKMKLLGEDTTENNEVVDKENGKDITESEGKKMKLSHKDTTQNNGMEKKEIGKKITENRREKMKLSRESTMENNGMGRKKDGEDTAKEVTPVRIDNDVRLVAEDTEIGLNETREDAKANTEEKIDDGKKCEMKNEVATLTDKDFLKEYKSPLQILTKSSGSLDCHRVDPNLIMCQYDLLGKCNDEECVFQHVRR